MTLRRWSLSLFYVSPRKFSPIESMTICSTEIRSLTQTYIRASATLLCILRVFRRSLHEHVVYVRMASRQASRCQPRPVENKSPVPAANSLTCSRATRICSGLYYTVSNVKGIHESGLILVKLQLPVGASFSPPATSKFTFFGKAGRLCV